MSNISYRNPKGCFVRIFGGISGGVFEGILGRISVGIFDEILERITVWILLRSSRWIPGTDLWRNLKKYLGIISGRILGWVFKEMYGFKRSIRKHLLR